MKMFNTGTPYEFNSTRFETLKTSKNWATVVKGNDKIHGSTFSIDPHVCNVGAKLRTVENSTCNKCYAIKLAKVYKSADMSWKRNLANFELSMLTDPMLWIESLVVQILTIHKNKAVKNKDGVNMHRWFTAGDLQSMDMLRAIVKVAELTPQIQHWLPTREQKLVADYLATSLDGFPDNLVVRISAPMVDGPALKKFPNTSTVHKDKEAIGFECPAYKQGGNCGTCTACLDPQVKNVSYKLH